MTHVLKKPADVVPFVIDRVSLDLKIASDFLKQGKIDEARQIATRILNEEPNNPAALYMVAWVFIKLEQHGIAYTLLKRSIDLKPRHEAWNNLGMALIGMGKLEEAESALQKSLKKSPEYQQALNNLALIAVYNAKPDAAIDYARRSIAQNPGQWEVRETLGYAQLMKGNLAAGWEGYEAMIGHTKWRTVEPPHAGCPYWMGEEGLDVYVHGEQGIGDEISFASILPEFADKQRAVVYECHEKLGGLFKRSFPNIEVHGTRWTTDKNWRDGRRFDAHTLIGTLATYYRREPEQFTGKPYLIADPERRLQWRALLDTLPGKKIGIAWTGGSKSTFKERRSLSLEKLLPILKTAGVTWVSLQYMNPDEEIAEFEKEHGIKVHHWKRASESNDYDDQAALVSELDGVVSVCTAIIHLAGALGVPCNVLVPSKPRWFYGMTGSTVPWYQSVRLFRQDGNGWPFESVRHAVKQIT